MRKPPQWVKFGQQTMLGAEWPVEFRFRNGHHTLIREDCTLLCYDNNGRVTVNVQEPQDADSLVALLAEIAARPRVTPQVGIALR